MGAFLTVVCITTTDRRSSAARAMDMVALHHPEANLRTVVVDDLVADSGARFVESLFAPREFARLAMLHKGPALIAAVRPTVLRSLVAEGHGTMIVLPDDAEVFGTLDALVAPIAAGNAVVLLLNRFAPPPSDGQLPDSVDAAQRGRHDQDLVAMRSVDSRALELLDAWIACLQRSPHVPVGRLDPMTYPWLDSLAERSGVVSITDASMPLSIRNADEPARRGEPVLVRWPSFDPATPWLFSAETGTLPRVRPSTDPRLASLANERSRQLLVAPDDLRSGAFEQLADGRPVDDVVRSAYASAIVRFESGNETEPPNPFAGDDLGAFVHWLSVPRGHLPSPYVEAFREVHTELRDALPTTDELTAWMRDRGAVAGIAPVFRPPPSDTSVAMPELRPGLEISGYLGAQFGMGEAARALVAAASTSAIPFTVSVDPRSAYHREGGTAHRTPGRTDPAATDDPNKPIAETYVAVRNADAVLADPSDVVAARAGGRRAVGYWFWEVAMFPDRLRPALDMVDELWVATEFVADALRAATSKPVRLLPFVPPAPSPPDERSRLRTAFARAHTIDDSRFVVSFSFDFDSVADRKNPWGVVEAYRLAFPDEGRELADGRTPVLVLKAIGAARHPIDHDRLLHAIGDRHDVMLIEEHLDADLQRGLFARSDAYLSLHRGEGLGLTMLEAFAAGCPVVCTAYGGNMSFCTEDAAFLVPFTLVDIPPFTPVYAGCGTWAEPSTESAARYLRAIADDPGLAARKVANAELHLVELRAQRSEAVAVFLRERVAESKQPNTEENDPMPEAIDEGELVPAESGPVTHRGLGPVVLPGAAAPLRSGGSGMLGAVSDRVRSTVEPMLAAQASFEQTRIVALVDAVQQTRQAVLDIEANARAERQTLTEAITGATTHTANLQSNHDSLYASVTELSTEVRTLTDSHLDLHAAINRIDGRLDAITADLRALLKGQPK